MKNNNNNYNEKREKKICAEIGTGYCPIVLQKEMKLYCNTVIVLQRFRLGGFGRMNCIAVGLERVVL